jgi:pimeloyl-ACP methyl ester carboxylesterase
MSMAGAVRGVRADVHFVPGTQCDQRLWHALWADLPDTVRPVHVPVPSGRDVNDIVRVLVDRLPPEGVSLVGFSLGGYLAALLACLYPRRVRRLMVIANTAQSLTEAERSRRQRYLSAPATAGRDGITRSRVRSLLHPRNHGREDIIQTVTDMDGAAGPDRYREQIRATSHREDLVHRIGGLSVPVDFLLGDEDRLVDPEPLHALAARCGHVRTLKFSGSGHMLPLECPHQVAAAVADWLTR